MQVPLLWIGSKAGLRRSPLQKDKGDKGVLVSGFVVSFFLHAKPAFRGSYCSCILRLHSACSYDTGTWYVVLQYKY